MGDDGDGGVGDGGVCYVCGNFEKTIPALGFRASHAPAEVASATGVHYVFDAELEKPVQVGKGKPIVGNFVEPHEGADESDVMHAVFITPEGTEHHAIADITVGDYRAMLTKARKRSTWTATTTSGTCGEVEHMNGSAFSKINN